MALLRFHIVLLLLWTTSVALAAATSNPAPSFLGPIWFERLDYNGTAIGSDAEDQDYTGFWFGNFTVGRASNVTLLIDTSSDFLALNPGLYRPTSSSKWLNGTAILEYGDLLANGSGSTANFEVSFYEDDIGFGGAVAHRQLIGVQLQEARGIAYHDGIIGFGGHSYNLVGPLSDLGIIHQYRFGLAFGLDGHGQMILGGVLPGYESMTKRSATMGGVDPRTDRYYVAGDIYAGKDLLFSSEEFILDTGSPVTTGPLEEVRKIFDALGMLEIPEGDGIVGVYPCDNPPKIGFGFPSWADAFEYSQPQPRSICGVGRCSNHSSVFPISPNGLIRRSIGNQCTATLYGKNKRNESFPKWTLGQDFFQGHYVDYDSSAYSGPGVLFSFAPYESVLSKTNH